MISERDNYDNSACVRLFEQFFTDADSLLDTLAPEGWESSPLFLAFHPTPQQRYEEEVEAAKDRPLPATALVYLNVYGKLPKGWPHR